MDKKVYILLTDTGTVFTKTIKQYTKAPYNHSSIAFDEHLLELYSFGRKNPRNPLYAGFIKEDILNGTYKLYPQTTCSVYEIIVTDRQIEKMKRMIGLFERKKDQMIYNIFGVIGVALREPLEPRGSYFCSQFVSELLERAGIKLWNKIPALVTPDDFRRSDKTKLVYEGLLLDYPPLKKAAK
ncbi:hypothetical protein [Evansella cellulosilytica]|uniref:Uncharacterized protein n=1 Tax=Evansella cellulosilytica (strain ATCC 21833 / DSM 2522 / FERM P-1141 / JCM 9156 / N-4) TaxID=649639 RepID=E6TW81_EVAC2|nr:hypothetical protein [Evansella cellulosilytica]ADU31037.1 hypothetical protein Bcell_2783 [Evansella cellulosilytica DSM 2522]